MAQTKRNKTNVPVNRIEEFLDKPELRSGWKPFSWPEESLPELFFPIACHQGFFLQAKMAEGIEHGREASDWTKLAQKLVERISLENRVEYLEKKIKEVTAQLTHVEGLCEKTNQKPIYVPISTFAPESFEVIREFSIVVQPEEDSFVATLFDANISSSGETQEEAVANVKDLILMIFKGFEDEEDKLGPAMIRQKHALLSLSSRSHPGDSRK